MADNATRATRNSKKMVEKHILESYDDIYEDMPERKAYLSFIKPNQLLPKARAIYDEKIEALGIKAMPILLDSGLLPSATSIRAGILPESVSPRPEIYLIVDESARRWDVNYIKEHVSRPDAYYSRMIEITDQGLIKANEEISAKLGVKPPATVYYKSQYDPTPMENYSGMTKEGNRIIVIDPTMTREQQEGFLTHEIGHHALHHNDPATVAKAHNAESAEVYRQMEVAADRQAVLAGRGRQLADALQATHERNKAYIEANNGVYSKEFQQEADPRHPLLDERIARIRAETKAYEAGKGCTIPPDVLSSLMPLKGGQNVIENDPPNKGSSKPPSASEERGF